MIDEANMKLLTGYFDSTFQDFESYLRNEVHLLEDDIGLLLNDANSIFITY